MSSCLFSPIELSGLGLANRVVVGTNVPIFSHRWNDE